MLLVNAMVYMQGSKSLQVDHAVDAGLSPEQMLADPIFSWLAKKVVFVSDHHILKAH